MSEITSLVTAEAVKEVLRSEEVLSALKQKLRQNLESRLDAEVDAILDELPTEAEAVSSANKIMARHSW